MTREHFNRDNLVVLDFQSIQQPTFRFSFQILDSIQASKLSLLPIFASRFPNLYDDLSNGETLARSRSKNENDRHSSITLFRSHSRNRSTRQPWIVSTNYGNVVSLSMNRIRCISKSLYFHTVFRPLLFIYQMLPTVATNCSLTSFFLDSRYMHSVSPEKNETNTLFGTSRSYLAQA